MSTVLVHPTVACNVQAIAQLQASTGRLVVIDGTGRVAKLADTRRQRAAQLADNGNNLPAA